jgi:hypothetical protein
MQHIADEDNYKYLEPFFEDDKLYLVLRLMKHAAQRTSQDPNYLLSLNAEEEKQTHIHKNKKLIKILCRYYRLYTLTPFEINKICNDSHDAVYDYIINRTRKILEYARHPDYAAPKTMVTVETLVLLKEAAAYDLNEVFYDLQNRVYDSFSENPIIKQMQTVGYKASNKVSLIRKITGCNQTPGNTYFSIDVKTANFSWLFNYVGNHILKLGVQKTFPEFISAFTDNPLLASSKHMRQIIFGKVFKDYKLNAIYEADINNITAMFTNLILAKYPALSSVKLMNEECIFLKTEDMNIEDIREELKKLEPEIGEIVNKLCVTEYTLRKVGNISLKDNDPFAVTPELGYQIVSGNFDQ